MPFFVIFLSINCPGAVTIRAVGLVGDMTLTSRQVLMSALLEKVSKSDGSLSLSGFDESSAEFEEWLSETLFEVVVEKEAENFSVAQVKEDEIMDQIEKLNPTIKNNSEWNSLEPMPEELKMIIIRKLRVKKFVKFKTESLAPVVTDQDVKEYYVRNRQKFGDSDFEGQKDSIRSFLKKEKQDMRLKEWFEQLNAKYRIRRLQKRG